MVVAIDDDQLNGPYVDVVQYYCPDTVDDADIPSHFEGLEIALTNLNGTHIPRLEIYCGARETAKSISRLLLEGSVFSHYLGELKKVSLWFKNDIELVDILPNEILSAPTQFTLDDITIPLSTAQRAEWLISRDYYGYDRRNYLRGLLEAFCAATAAPDADPQLATITLPEAEAGVSARTEVDAESARQVNKDGEEMESGEPATAVAGQAEEEPRDDEGDGPGRDGEPQDWETGGAVLGVAEKEAKAGAIREGEEQLDGEIAVLDAENYGAKSR